MYIIAILYLRKPKKKITFSQFTQYYPIEHNRDNYYTLIIAPKVNFNYEMLDEFQNKYGNVDWYKHDIEGYDDLCYSHKCSYNMICFFENTTRECLIERFVLGLI